MAFQVKVDPVVFKQIKKIPPKDILRIQFAVKNFADNPYAGDVKKLAGENVWRRRVGAYRIIFEIIANQGLVHVINVERRTSKTY